MTDETPAFDAGFENTHDDHCRDCVPYDMPAGTTVICEHRNHHHHEGSTSSTPRHVVISAGGEQPARPEL